MSRLEFGVDDPPPPKRGEKLKEVGWHPGCFHVKHIPGPSGQLEGQLSPGLVYGLLTDREAVDRLGDCDVCRPPAQAELAL